MGGIVRAPPAEGWLEGTTTSASRPEDRGAEAHRADSRPAADIAAASGIGGRRMSSKVFRRCVSTGHGRAAGGGCCRNAASAARVTAMTRCPCAIAHPLLHRQRRRLAAAAYFLSLRGRSTDLSLDVVPNLPVTA